MSGRHSVKRKRHVTESQDKYSKSKTPVSGIGGPIGRTIQCKNYLQRVHNKLSCKNAMVAPEPNPNKKMGRPRVKHDANHWTRGGVRRGTKGSDRIGSRGGGKRYKHVENQEKCGEMGFRSKIIPETELIDLWRKLEYMRESRYSHAES